MAIGALTLASSFTLPASSKPYGVIASPDSKNLYVIAQGASSTTYGIAQLAINQATGALSAISGKPTVINTTNGPQWGAISPDGKHLYIGVSGNSDLYIFTRDLTDGSLTQPLPKVTANVSTPFHISVSPDGAHVYVAMYGNGTIRVYSRNASTGALTEIQAPALAGVYSVAISPDGNAAYAVSSSANTIASYARDNNPASGTYGQLTSIGTALTTASGFPDDLTITDDGKFVYVATDSNNQITCCYKRDTSTNLLTAITNPSPVYQVTAAGPWGIALSKDSKNSALYLAQSDGQRITQFSRDTTTGANAGQLTLMTPQYVSTSNYNGSSLVSSGGPYGIAVTPNGKFLYATALPTDKVDVFTIEQAPGASLTVASGTSATTGGTVAVTKRTGGALPQASTVPAKRVVTFDGGKRTVIF